VMLDDTNWSLVELRDRRYDAIIHLVTAAIGAEKFYTTENNAARTETAEEARKLDLKILNAWIGQPTLRIIDNSTNFQEKIQRTTECICQVVGAQKPKNRRRKFLVENIVHEKRSAADLKYEEFEIELTYHSPWKNIDGNRNHGYQFLRRRGQNDSYAYTHHTIKSTSELKMIGLSRNISGREYLGLQKQADPSRRVLKKLLHCFTYNNFYYELEAFVSPKIGMTVVSVEVDESHESKNITFPPFIKVIADITDADEFKSYTISKNFKNHDGTTTWKSSDAMSKQLHTARQKKSVNE